MKIRYQVYLIEKAKRVFLRGFDQYENAYNYCKENKEQNPKVYFLISAYSTRQKMPLTMLQGQSIF